MKLGVDSSVLVACLHANHPFHIAAADWMNHSFENHEVVVAHHSVLEAYDGFVIEILAAARVEAIATGNAREFRRLSRGIRIIDPYERDE